MLFEELKGLNYHSIRGYICRIEFSAVILDWNRKANAPNRISFSSLSLSLIYVLSTVLHQRLYEPTYVMLFPFDTQSKHVTYGA